MKPKLYIIMATAGDVGSFENLGFLERFQKQIDIYKKGFDVEILSSDKTNYSELLDVRHRIPPLLVQIPILKHALYSIFLVMASIMFRRGVIRVFGVSNPALYFIKLFSRNPIAASYHYDWVDQERVHHNTFKWIVAILVERFVFKSLDYVFPTTKRLEKKIKKMYNIKTVVIPNFVDNSVFYPSTRKKRQIVFVGRIHWLKGLDYLLDAVSRFDKSLKTIIIGNGNEIHKIKRMSKRLDLKNVVFTGSLKQNALSSYLRESYALILPTITMEGHPKVIIEAFASGTPCIVTDVRGSREIVKNDVNGLIVKPKDSKELSRAIEMICEDKALKKKLSKNALNEGNKYYIEKILSKEIEMLKSM